MHIFSFNFGQPPGSLVGYWKMDEGSGVTFVDNSGYGNNAAIQNEHEVLWITGKDNLAVFLPGTSNRFGLAPSSSSLNITDYLTIAAWIKPIEVRNGALISKTGSDGYEIGTTSTGKIEFKFNADTYGSLFTIQSNATYPADGNTWMHVAATYDGATSKIYINGILDKSVTFPNPVAIKSNNTGLYIGSSLGSKRWKGGIDDLRLYHAVLNATEIAQLIGIPGTTLLNAPANSATGIPYNQTLSWNTVSGASNYSIEVSQDAGFSSSFFAQGNIQGSSVLVSNLSPSTLYYWRVRASNSYGDGNWSAVWNFTTAPLAPPTLVAPANSSVDAPYNQTLTWNAVVAATKYSVQVSERSDFANTILDQNNITATSVSLSSLWPNTVYYWRVRASNGVSSGNWSAVWSFRTMAEAQTALSLTSVAISSNNSNPSMAKAGNIVTLSFTASEPINTPVVSIATHPVTVTAGSGNSFTAQYIMSASDIVGPVPFRITYSNLSGVSGPVVLTTTNGSSVTFDNIRPQLISIKRQSPSTTTTANSSVTFRATFSEAVTGVNTPDFGLTIVGALNLSIASVTPVSGAVYDVTVSSISGNGTIRLDLKNSGTGINDLAGNAVVEDYRDGESYTIQQAVVTPGFSSVTPITPFEVTKETKDKPQGKTWKYANKWWCVLAVNGGTKLFRLDGTDWTAILTLTTSNSKPDCIVSGNLVHVLCYKSTSLFYTLEYDQALNNYKLWSQVPPKTTTKIAFPSGTQTATIIKDGTGRIWAASDGTSTIGVWWSDAPYTTWSGPVNVATNVTDDDICVLAALPGQNKIGILWSDQVKREFGFRTHTDGASPSSWSTPESPARQSALDKGKGFADNHLNLKVASDGTIYCAAKTSYDKPGYPELILLVRRPSGIWDDAYTVENSEPGDGTQPCVLLNEAEGKLKVVFTTSTNGGSIVYRESSTSNISFGASINLISSENVLYNYASSIHQNYNSEVMIMATEVYSGPLRMVSFLATDPGSSSPPPAITSAAAKSLLLVNEKPTTTTLQAYPNPFTTTTNLKFKLEKSGNYAIVVYDNKGSELFTFEKGWAEGGQENIRRFNKGSLGTGLYMVSLKTSTGIKTIKLIKD